MMTMPERLREITMSGMNLLLANAGDRREEIKTFVMPVAIFAALVGDSKYIPTPLKGGTHYSEVVQAFGRDVITPFRMIENIIVGLTVVCDGTVPLIVTGAFADPQEKHDE